MKTWTYKPTHVHAIPDEDGECWLCGEVVPEDYESPDDVRVFTIEVGEVVPSA